MRQIAQALDAAEPATGRLSFSADTAFLVFFLGMDLGQRLTLGLDGLMTGMTLAMFIVFPYFLPSFVERPKFDLFVMSRTVIALLAVFVGLALNQATGVLLPESFRFVPLMLVMTSGFVSCLIQLSNFMKFRLVK